MPMNCLNMANMSLSSYELSKCVCESTYGGYGGWQKKKLLCGWSLFVCVLNQVKNSKNYGFPCK